MRRAPKVLVPIAVALVFFAWVAPWRLFECGTDEGMEFSKMLLVLRDPAAVHLAWNDQPWFYSKLLATMFSATGFHAWVARLLTLAVVCLLSRSLLRLLPRGAGWPHLLCAWLMLWTWPYFAGLSVSAMPDLVGFALGVLAIGILPRSASERGCWRFVGSGLLLAVGVQVKPTALLVLPALAVGAVRLRDPAANGRRPVRCAWLRRFVAERWLGPASGMASFAVWFAMLQWWSPRSDWTLICRVHYDSSLASQAAHYAFKPIDLLAAPGPLLGAGLAVPLLLRRRRLNEVTPLVVLFITVLVAHLVWRPWWYYYTVHFAVPLAVLGGWGTGELLRRGLLGPVGTDGGGGATRAGQRAMMLGALCLSLCCGFELPRAYEDASDLRFGRAIPGDEELQVLKAYRNTAKWIFTRDNTLAAEAGYLLPPELTILSKKRFWSREATPASVLKAVTRYHCEVLVLQRDLELRDRRWQHFVKKGYVPVWSDDTEEIFVTRRLCPVQPPGRRDVLHTLGV
jgi:hypothetical protein